MSRKRSLETPEIESVLHVSCDTTDEDDNIPLSFFMSRNKFLTKKKRISSKIRSTSPEMPHSPSNTPIFEDFSGSDVDDPSWIPEVPKLKRKKVNVFNLRSDKYSVSTLDKKAVVDPIRNTLLEPVETIKDPSVLKPIEDPETESIDDHALTEDPVLEPAVNPVLEPAVNTVLEPAVNPVVEPHDGSMKQPKMKLTAKLKRQKGERYIGYKKSNGKITQDYVRASREIKLRCNHNKFVAKSSRTFLCALFNEKDRKDIHSYFWKHLKT